MNFFLLSLALILASLAKDADSFCPPSLSARKYYGRPVGNQRPISSTTLGVALTTNLEYLAGERYNDDFSAPAYQAIEWMDPASPSTDDITDDNVDCSMTIPIYPIPAVYLPFTNHTLNNVEPRNLEMALDLNQTDKDEKLFCVTLRAADTGRISRWGTLLRMTGLEPSYQTQPVQRDNGSVVTRQVLTRITVSCEAVGIVEIGSIENPEAASPLQRLKRSSEYLRGRVVPISTGTKTTTTNNDSGDQEASLAIETVKDDLALIKTMYELGIGSAGTISTSALQELASAIPSSLSSRSFTVWEVAQLWQSICDTIRVGRQSMLAADRNEFLVDAACRKGGTLKLPVHPEDLEPADRRQLAEWEATVQRAFVDSIQLDPCLDFLPLLGMKSDADRWQWLAKMIARERQRLEEAASDFGSSTSGGSSSSLEDDLMLELLEEETIEEPVRKGAWFDDGVW